MDNRLFNKKQLALLIVGAILFLLTCIAPCPEGLALHAVDAGSTGRASFMTLGTIILCACWWVGECFPTWLTALMIPTVLNAVCGFSFTDSFAGFVSTSMWIIAGACVITKAVTKTGFFRRMALNMMKLFSPTYRGQALALLVVGAIISPMVPSASAKGLLGASLAFSLANEMGYESDSPRRVGIFIASLFGFSMSSVGFLNGSISTYTMYSNLPEEVREEINWGVWFKAMLPWLALTTLAVFLLISYFGRKDEGKALTKSFIADECKAMGKLEGKELISAIILFVAVIFWVLEDTIGISSATVAVLGAMACFMTGILEKKELNTAVPWGLVIMLGCVLNLSAVFKKSGIDAWMLDALDPVVSNIHSTVLFLAIVVIMSVCVRLCMISQVSVVILLMTIAAPLAMKMGINPLIVGTLLVSTGQCWIMPYQNTMFNSCISCMNGTVTHKQCVKYSAIYIVVNWLVFVLLLPYWHMIGLQ